MNKSDKSFSKIQKYSYIIYNYAVKKYRGKNFTDRKKKKIQKYIEKMESLLPEVDAEHLMPAKKHISESSLEANYIINGARYVSLRLGNVIRNSPPFNSKKAKNGKINPNPIKIVDIFPVENKLSITLEGGPCQKITNGCYLLVNNNNEQKFIRVISVAMPQTDPAKIKNNITILIDEYPLEIGLELFLVE